MKKLLLGLSLVCGAALAQAQTMLDGVVVEKYHVATSADHALDANLPIGATTYRVYIHMKAGYKLQSVYGDANHALTFATTTLFYNSPTGSGTAIGINNPTGADLYDSWISLGNASKGKLAVPIAENTSGQIAGANAAIVTTSSTLDNAITASFDTQPGANTFSINGDAYANTGGVVGSATSNSVLIGQFTTDGNFSYSLNFQLGNTTGDAEVYVASSPNSLTDGRFGEYTATSLAGVYAPNVAPTVAITTAGSTQNLASGVTTYAATVTATATDAVASGFNGAATVSKVEFFDGTTSLGVATLSNSVYSLSKSLSAGSHVITAVATDNDAATTTSAPITIQVNLANIAPTVSLVSDKNLVNLAQGITLTASAADIDGTIASIEFFDGTTSLGAASTATTKAIASLTAGSHSYTAKAIDNSGAATISVAALVTATNALPTISAITSSVSSTVNAGTPVSVSVTATDAETTNLTVVFTGATFSSVTKSGNVYSASFPATEGTNTIAATATDANSGVATANAITIQALAIPTVTGLSVTKADGSAGSIVEGDNVKIEVVAKDAQSVTLYKDGQPWKTYQKSEFKAYAVADSYDATTGVFTFTWVAEAGTINITATASNGLTGGVSSVSPSLPVPVLGTTTTITSYPTTTKSYAISNVSFPCVEDYMNVNIKKTATGSLSRCTGFDIVLNYDKSKVVPTGDIAVGNGLINPLYVGYTYNIKAAEGKMNISLYLNGNGDTTKYFAGADQLLTSITFAKLATFRVTDTVLFSASITESYDITTKTAQIETGRYSSYRDTVLKSSVKFWADNQLMKINATDLPISIIRGTDTTFVDDKGTFKSTGTKADNTISISRDIENTVDVMPVINGYDALLTAEVAVENAKFVPTFYQLIAMDVNRDGVISAGDVSQINKRTILTIPYFTQVNDTKKDWLFVDSFEVATLAKYQRSSLYPLADGIGYSKDMVPSVSDLISLGEANSCYTDKATYVGILIGDANGSYKNVTPTNTSDYSKLKSDVVSSVNAEVVFDYAKATTSTIDGVKYLDIPVVVNSDVAVSSLDFALTYDATNLQYNSIVNSDAAIKTLAHVGDDNTLRFTSYSFTGFTTGVTVVSVRFELKSDIVTPISSTKAYINGEPVASEVSGNSNDNATALTANVYPNPAKDILTVVVSQTSKIEVINVLTQSVYSLENVAPNQIHTINTSSFAKGTYYVKVTSANSSVTKVIIIQ